MARGFRALYFGGILAEIVIRAPFERQRRRAPKREQRVSAAEKGVLGALVVAMILLPLLYTLTQRLDFADYPLSPKAQRRAGWLGAAFMGAALWLFRRAHQDLGANGSPTLEIGTEHQLVTEGVYGAIRHPMYASQALWAVAQALLLPNWIAGFGGLVGYLPLYAMRVPAEERMMEETFGEGYRRYAARTGRIVPGWRRGP